MSLARSFASCRWLSETIGPCVPTWISRVGLLFGLVFAVFFLFLLPSAFKYSFINGVHFVLSVFFAFFTSNITHFITNFDSVRLILALTSKADDVLFCFYFFCCCCRFLLGTLVPLSDSKINIKHLCVCACMNEQERGRERDIFCKWTRSVVNRAIGNCVEWLLSIKALYALIFILLVDLSHQSD